MARTGVQREMKELFGEVIKRVQVGETLVPNKYKEISGLAVAAATRCRYCALFHTEAAKLFDAADERCRGGHALHEAGERPEPLHHGMQVDYD